MTNDKNNTAYVFRIHGAKRDGDANPTSADNMSGWTKTDNIAGDFLKNIPIGLSANKTGTSIPSIFARLFLFEGAFQTMGGAAINQLVATDADTRLISECLDMLEFLFQHGNDPKLVIKHWNAADQIQNLRNDGNDKHRKLAKVLEDEVKGRPLNDIYLFYWKASSPLSALTEKEYLIGGTSPFTLAFTSPNWKRIVRENSFRFNRVNGRPMFTEDNVESLQSRDDQFKDMLYSLRMAYSIQLENQAQSFNKYLTTMWNNDVQRPEVMAMGNNPAAFLAKYSRIKDENGADVISAVIPLCYQNIEPVSDYEIVPKSNRYANYLTSAGQPITLRTPLALNNNGLPNVKYIGTSTWDAQTCRINEAVVRTTEMHNRIAPGDSGVKYPFLIWSDFLEDKIIKLPYRINKDRFVTASAGDTQYLLPLKRTFFKYFNINDISESAYQGAEKKLVEIESQNNSVTVTINVPIKDQTYHSIELKRTYQGTDIVESEFIVGFFPFYRCDNQQLNRYSVMNCGNDTRLGFVSIDEINGMINATSVERTPRQQLIKQTEYYLIKEGFDMVEVVVNRNNVDVKGMIIPKMVEVNMANPTNHYDFAVDFGTSNTYVAHATNAARLPESFEIGEQDQQTVLLNDPKLDKNAMYIMKPFIQREFAPVGLGKGFDISYPARTATCEVPNFEARQPELFGTISIGFNMMREPQVPNGEFQYKTGLKWLLEDNPGNQHHTNRIKYYFLQTLWMMKNESLLNDGGDTFDVYLTFPQSMKDQQLLINLWQWAINELQLQNCTLHYGPQFSESIAPYNCMAAQIGGASYLNIDIGGGTNDLLFVNKDIHGMIQSAYYSSAKFAGDDLWGDGIQILNNQAASNGFVAYVTSLIDEANGVYQQEILNPLTALRQGLASSSADIMSYLFKYESMFETSAKIRGQRNLWSLVFIHYAAVMYNVARLIKKLQIAIPEKISFTGMGSKYISLISANDGIRSITKLLLEKYTGQNVPRDFQIINAGNTDVKEITAKGVLQGLNFANQNYAIQANLLNQVSDYGFDTTDAIMYSDVKNADGVVRKKALDEFKHFVGTLNEKDFRNFLFNQHGLTISEELITDLLTKGEASFTTMSASIPAQFDQLNLVETLFFWPLKNALIELSRNYDKYQ